MGTFALHFEGMKLLFLFAVATFSSATYAASIEGPLLSIKDLMGGMEGKRNNRVLSWADKPEIPKEEQGERKEQLEEEKELPEGEKGQLEVEEEQLEGEKKLPEGEKELPEGEEELLESKIEQLVKEKEQLEGEKEKLQDLLELLDFDIFNLSKALGRVNIALGNLREQQIRRANMQEKRTI